MEKYEAEQCIFLFGLIFLEIVRYQRHMLKKVPMDEGHMEHMVSVSYFFQIHASQMLCHQHCRVQACTCMADSISGVGKYGTQVNEVV